MRWLTSFFFFFFFNDTATTEIYTLSLHDALPIWAAQHGGLQHGGQVGALVRVDELLFDGGQREQHRSEEHTSELQSRLHLVCRLLLEKKKKKRCTPSCITLSTAHDTCTATHARSD